MEVVIRLSVTTITVLCCLCAMGLERVCFNVRFSVLREIPIKMGVKTTWCVMWTLRISKGHIEELEHVWLFPSLIEMRSGSAESSVYWKELNQVFEVSSGDFSAFWHTGAMWLGCLRRTESPMLLGHATSLQLQTLSWKFKLCVSVSKYLFIIISYFNGIVSIKKNSSSEYECKLRYVLMEERLLENKAVAASVSPSDWCRLIGWFTCLS